MAKMIVLPVQEVPMSFEQQALPDVPGGEQQALLANPPLSANLGSSPQILSPIVPLFEARPVASLPEEGLLDLPMPEALGALLEPTPSMAQSEPVLPDISQSAGLPDAEVNSAHCLQALIACYLSMRSVL